MSVMHITKANYDELVKNSDKPVLLDLPLSMPHVPANDTESSEYDKCHLPAPCNGI